MYIRKLFLFLASVLALFATTLFAEKKPNIVLFMADDMGWGDTGFNGSEVAITPNLDGLAKDGAVLNHFYSIGPVCSPTRASFLTGRHYSRIGVFYANRGMLNENEYTIAHMLKENGYTTGHFGKWHLGTLSKTHSPKKGFINLEKNFAPPWERGYDESFVNEIACVTYDVGKDSDYKKNPYYHNGKVVPATDNLEGDDSRIIMDRAIPFIEKAVANNTPFLSVIWFHTPHIPVVAGKKYLDMYSDRSLKDAHYFGAITAMDEQIGRLREKLKELGQEDNTLMFFCSDNGPTAFAGSTGVFKGLKRSVHEGGVRVPAVVYYPKNIKAGTFLDVPMSIMDLLPTIAAVSDVKINTTHVLDGEDVLPILEGKRDSHIKSIPFRADDEIGTFACLVKGKYKIIIQSPDNMAKDQLYNLANDEKEENNIASSHPELVSEMRAEILAFLESAKNSHAGGEYDVDFEPLSPWRELGCKVTKEMGWPPAGLKTNHSKYNYLYGTGSKSKAKAKAKSKKKKD